MAPRERGRVTAHIDASRHPSKATGGHGEVQDVSPREGAMPSNQELVRSSRFIFSGVVVGLSQSSVPALRPGPGLITARLERSLRVDPVLGDIRGKIITVVAKAPQSLRIGQQTVFFANSWIRGRGLAVREVGRVDVDQADDVAAEVAKLPEQHLEERLRSAALVVTAEIVSIDPPAPTFDQHSGLWAAAHLDVGEVLRGPPGASAVLYFPTAAWPPFDRMPHFNLHQRGVFLLHVPSGESVPGERGLPPGGLIATDPDDFRDLSEIERIRQALSRIQ
jgi:hypothetical protein